MADAPTPVGPVSEGVRTGIKALLPEEQVRHQTWDDPQRLSIQIDCPPGEPRPPEAFASTIEDTGLTPEDFEDSGSTIFGCREYLVRADPGTIFRYVRARRTIGERLVMMYERGIVRGVTW